MEAETLALVWPLTLRELSMTVFSGLKEFELLLTFVLVWRGHYADKFTVVASSSFSIRVNFANRIVVEISLPLSSSDDSASMLIYKDLYGNLTNYF